MTPSNDTAWAAVREAVARVRETRADVPDDLYALGKAAQLDPGLAQQVGYADAFALWSAEAPDLDAELLVHAAEVAQNCTADEVKTYSMEKMWVYLQLVHEGVIPRETKHLVDQILDVPENLASDRTYAQAFADATVAELERMLEWNRARSGKGPQPNPASPQPPVDRGPDPAPRPRNRRPAPPPRLPLPPPPAPRPRQPLPPPPVDRTPDPAPPPPLDEPQPAPPPPQPPVDRAPDPAAPPPGEPQPALVPPQPLPTPPVDRAPDRAPPPPGEPQPAPLPDPPALPPTAAPNRPGRWALAAIGLLVAGVIGYRFLVQRSEQFQDQHRSRGAEPAAAQPAPPVPATHSATAVPPTRHPHPAFAPDARGSPPAVEDEENDLTQEQLNELRKNEPRPKNWDPLK